MKRNTAELKEKLIETGVKEIRTRGVDQLSIRTVAQRCGVTHGAPYKHFENKDVYLQVVLERLSEIFLKCLTQGVDSSLDVRGMILTSVILVVGLSGAELAVGPVVLKGMGLATVVGMAMSISLLILQKTGVGNDQLKKTEV